jgi:chromosome segregation ATPase
LEEAPEVLSEADEVRFDVPPAGEVPEHRLEDAAPADAAAASAFLSAEAARDDRLDVLEQRLHDVDARAGREREAAERLFETVAATEARVAAAAEHLSALTERLSAVERGVGGLHEALGSTLQRLAAVEEGASGRAGELEGGLRRLEAAVSQLEGELRGETGRQRKDADDMAMALSALTERAQTVDRELSSAIGRLAGHNDRLSAVAELAERTEEQVAALRSVAEKLPGFETQIESILQDHRELEEAFEEKTQLGRREAEDIRSQLAPLLEDRVRRHESDAMLFDEMERLRESLAESLHELAERVRTRVRE